MGIADVRIYSSLGQIFDLQDPDTYMIGEENSVGVAVEDITFTSVGTRNYDVPHVIGMPNREIGLNVYITGTSVDNLITKFRNLEEVFAQALKYYDDDGKSGAKAWVQFKLDSGSYVTEYDILNGVIDGSSILETTDEITTIMMPITLIVKAPAHSQANLIAESAAMDNGDTFLISAPVGDIDSPAKVSLQMISGGTVVTEFFIGKKSRGNVNNFQFVMECETGTFTNYSVADGGGTYVGSDVANAAAHGGFVRRVALIAGTSQKVLIWTITNNTKDFYGKYYVFLKNLAAGNYSDGATLKYGGPNGDRIALTEVTTSISPSDLTLLGTMQIPEEDYPSDEPTEFKFSIYLNGSASPGNYDLDCIYLMPIDEEYFRWQSDTTFTNNERIVSNNLGNPYRAYALESDGDLQSDNPLTPLHDDRFTIIHGVDQKLCWLAYSKTTTDMLHRLTNKGKLIVEYQELLALLK